MRTASTTSSANFSLKFRSAGDSGDPQAVEFVLVCVKKIAKQCSDVTKLHSSQVYEMTLQPTLQKMFVLFRKHFFLAFPKHFLENVSYLYLYG